MSTVQVKLAGVDRTNQTVFSSAYFESAVNGVAGQAKVRFRDPDRTMTALPGQVLELIIDGDPVWYGFVQQWKRVFVFPALNVDDFGETRFFDVVGSDLNLLFAKRIVFNQTTPENVLSPIYGPNTPDVDAITDLLADWLDLSGDGLDTSSGIVPVATINEDQKARPWEGSDTWGQAMQSIASLPAAIYYLRPNKVFAYVDTDTPDAPFGLSDVPHTGGGSSTVTLTDDFGRTVAANTTGWGTGGLGAWGGGAGDTNYSVDGSDGIATPVDPDDTIVTLLQAVAEPAAAGADNWSLTVEMTWPDTPTNLGAFQINLYDDPVGDNWGLSLGYSRVSGNVNLGWYTATDDGADFAPTTPDQGAIDATFHLEYDAETGVVSGSYADATGTYPLAVSGATGFSGTPLVYINGIGFDSVSNEFLVRSVEFAYGATGSSEFRGYREMEILLDGSNLANDVMTWGIGYGSSRPVFKRAIDAASVAEHGLWQLGQVTYGVYKQATIDRIADSILNGSPEHHRGSKDDRTAVILTTYEPGLLPAQKVPFESQVFGFSDVFPIRKMEVTFEAPDKPKYVMALSHEIDAPWSFFDPWKFKFPGFKLPRITPPVIPSPPGCSPFCEPPTYRSVTDDYVLTYPYEPGNLHVTLGGDSITVTETDPAIGVFNFETGDQSAGMVACYAALNRFDNFDRSASGSWGPTRDGHTWQTFQYVPDSPISVSGGVAQIENLTNYVTADRATYQYLEAIGADPWTFPDAVMVVRFKMESLPPSDPTFDTNLTISFGTGTPPFFADQIATITVDEGGVLYVKSGVSSFVSLGAAVAGVYYIAKFDLASLKAKVWEDGTTEPDWQAIGSGSVIAPGTVIYVGTSYFGHQTDHSDSLTVTFDLVDFDYTGKPCYAVCGPGPGGDCAFDALTDWTITTNTADTGMETQVADDFIAARQIAGTTHTNSELAAITVFRDLSGDPNYTTLAQLGTYRFPYRIFGDYTLSDTPFPYARVRALVSLAASSVQVTIERNGPSGTSTTDDVTVTCPSGVGGTFTIPRTMDTGFIDIYIGVGTVTVTVQGVTQTYSPGAMTPDPDSAQMTANVQSTSTGTPLAEGRIGPMYFIPIDGSGVPWCTTCVPGPLPGTGHPVIGPGRELAIRIDATHYRTSWAMVPNSSQVWVDGALFVLGTDYTEDAPTGTLLFAAPVADTAVVSVTYTAVGPPPGTYPADTTPTYVVTPSASDPAYLAPYGDPTWFTTITRISNIRGVRQAYSRYQAWSKDSDFIMLPFTGAGQSPHLLDGTTYADLGTFSPPNMAVWSNLVNDKIFGVTGNQLVWKTMAGASTTIHTFSGYSSISLGEYEGGISDDDRYVALIGDPSGSAHLLTYDILLDTVIADIPAPSGISDCQISRLGNYVTTATGSGIRCYPRDLSSFRTLQSDYSHGDNALDASGREIFVTNNDGGSPQAVASYLLSSGAKTVLISAAPSHQAFEYGHVSGHHNRPGWVYLSNYDETITAGQIGCDQVVAVKTDGSQIVEVFGFAHHIYDNSDPTMRYACEPHATASRDGSRVIFASNWGNPAVYPYCYVARAA